MDVKKYLVAIIFACCSIVLGIITAPNDALYKSNCLDLVKSSKFLDYTTATLNQKLSYSNSYSIQPVPIDKEGNHIGVLSEEKL